MLGGNRRPMEPEKWTTRYLLAYSVLHGLLDGAERSTMSKEKREELELMVARDIRAFYERNDLAECAVQPSDALSTDPTQLLVRRAQPGCAELFRQNPEKLEAVFEAGLAQLIATPLLDARKSADGSLPWIEWWLMFTIDDAAQQKLEYQGAPRVCGRTPAQHEAIVYCMECGVDSQCIFCADCFQNSPCVGHKHVVRCSSGENSICDCGDPSAWNPASFCRRHRGFSMSDDPTAEMDPVCKRWLEVVARGLVLYQLTVMRMFMLELPGQTGHESHWSARWLDRLLRRAVAVTLQLAGWGEGSRRILCFTLMGKAFMARQITPKVGEKKPVVMALFSCLEEFFLNSIEITDTKELIIWEKSSLLLLDTCIPDPVFRLPFAELLLKYGERLSVLHDRHVKMLSVQVLTVKDVVDALLQYVPQPPWERVLVHETILHRHLSVLLYMCCNVKKNREVLMAKHAHVVSYCCQSFIGTIDASSNTKAIVVSRLMFRAWYKLLSILGSSSVVRHEGGGSTSGKFTTVKDYALTMHLELQQVFYAIGNMAHDIGLALMSGDEPVPSWLRESLQSLPTAWERPLDAFIDCPSHRKIIDSLTLQHASPLLLDANVGDEDAPHRAYMRELLTESMISINSILAKKRASFKPRVFVLSGMSGEPLLPQYDLVDEKSFNPTSFVVPHMRFFAVLVKMWTRLQQKAKNGQHRRACDVATDRTGPNEQEQFYSLISEVFAATQSRPDYWLDECLMPLVLFGQMEEGLWYRDDCDVTRRCAIYAGDLTLGMETDLYLLQLLMLIIPTELYAIQVLQRHTLKENKARRALCYTSFLRLILTLSTAECGAAVDDAPELRKAVQQLLVHGMVTEPRHSFRSLESDVGDFEHFIPGVHPKEMLPSILKEIAVGVQQERGQNFRLKDAETWRANVNLYHPMLRDSHSFDMYDVYKRLVRREWMSQKRIAQDAPASQESPVKFPPPKLLGVDDDIPRLGERQAVLYHKICLLLQTAAVLSAAIDVVHHYLHHVVKRVELKGIEYVNKCTLAHAVSVLYLSMRASKAISFSVSPPGALGEIDWDAVKKFQNRFMPPSGYNPNQLQDLYSIPDIMGAVTLKEKLDLPVHSGGNKVSATDRKGKSQGTTTVAALLELRKHFSEDGTDEYGFVEMIEFILRGVGALSPSHETTKMTSCAEQSEYEDRRRRRIKERQTALLQRVRANDARTIIAMGNADDDDRSNNNNNNNDNTNNTNNSNGVSLPVTDGVAREEATGSTEPQYSLTARLLLRLSESECCMCLSRSSEPLLLLANTSTSDSLYRLRFDPSRDGDTGLRKLNAHLYVCGHAAHKTCVAKTFGKLANLWAGTAESRSRQTVLGPLEFNCPICVMICTTFCPFPTLITCAGRQDLSPSLTSEIPSSSSSSSSLFELVRRDTLHVLTSHKASTTVIQGLHKNLAFAAVGQSKTGREEDLFLEPCELQERNPSLWILVETLRAIRTQVCIAVEWVKAGGKVQYNDLLGLLALMVSLDVEILEANASALREELCHDDDGLCVLLLKLLQNPGEAVLSLIQYTILLLTSTDYTVLTSPPTTDDGNAYRNLLIAIWKELGCLSILKMLLSGAAPAVLPQCMDDRSIFVLVDSGELTTLEGQQHAVLTMLCYLLDQRSFLGEQKGDPGVALASLVRVVVARYRGMKSKVNDLPTEELMHCKPLRATYEDPASWRRYILRHLFHLSDTLYEMLLTTSSSDPCSVCGDTEAQRVLCCFCGQRLCARPLLTPPELYAHACTCGRGVGVYIHPRENIFTVLLTLSDRYLYLQSLYTDEYGQKNIYDFRGHMVYIDNEAAMHWLSLWMRSRWGVESTVIKRMVRTNLKVL